MRQCMLSRWNDLPIDVGYSPFVAHGAPDVKSTCIVCHCGETQLFSDNLKDYLEKKFEQIR